MLFVCCAIKLLRSTFQLPSLALSLSTPPRGMASVYNHPELPGSRLSEELGTAPCAELPVTQCLAGCSHPQTGWEWWFSSQYSYFPTFSHCKPISTICDGCLHSFLQVKPMSSCCQLLPRAHWKLSHPSSPLLYSQTFFASLSCCTCATPEPCPASEPVRLLALEHLQRGVRVWQTHSQEFLSLFFALSHCPSPVPPWHFHDHVPWSSKAPVTWVTLMEGKSSQVREGKVAHSKQSCKFCKADTSSANAQADYPIHLKGFIRRRQETLVSRMENLESFCPVWGDSSTSNAVFCRVPHSCASSLKLLPDSHPV